MQPATPQPQADTILQTLMPTMNKPALLAYYFGVFGFTPILGLPLTAAALIFGHKGMKLGRAQPTPGAKAHAMAGIVMAWIQLAIFAVFMTFMIISLNTKA
jgi:hypothetical protein